MTDFKTMSVEQLRNRLQERISALTERLGGLNKATHYKQFYNIQGELRNAQIRLQKLNERTGFTEGVQK